MLRTRDPFMYICCRLAPFVKINVGGSLGGTAMKNKIKKYNLKIHFEPVALIKINVQKSILNKIIIIV